MIKTLPRESEMDRAMYARDTSYDGLFFGCVRTTGVFCRPSCAARKPNKKNLIYHATVRDCLLDGFRPCKRCRPLAINGHTADWLDTLIEKIEESPGARLSDADLSASGMSPYRIRRYFVRNFGMTFQAYHRTRRMGLALEQLQAGGGSVRSVFSPQRSRALVLTVAFDHSYESLSGFRDAFQRVFGTTPGQSAGVQCIVTTRVETPLGPMVAAATEEGVCLLEFADRRAFQRQTEVLRRRLKRVIVPGHNAHLDRLAKELTEYFDGTRRTFSVPLVCPGTAFQQKTWEELRRIPYGSTTSYSRLARTIGHPGSQRAVGRANGDNRIAIVIPCHRVVKDDGTLCGYGGGVWRKQHLLDLEKAGAPGAAETVRERAWGKTTTFLAGA
jgi:AraC family transcriptional regulator of adaptative response/methylated-DNA-[protein]-cysteine methyltransferase